MLLNSNLFIFIQSLKVINTAYISIQVVGKIPHRLDIPLKLLILVFEFFKRLDCCLQLCIALILGGEQGHGLICLFLFLELLRVTRHYGLVQIVHGLGHERLSIHLHLHLYFGLPLSELHRILLADSIFYLLDACKLCFPLNLVI